MAEITRIDVQGDYIDSRIALYNLRLSSPYAYDKVLKLRSEYPELMKLSRKRIILLQHKAVESLIRDGICKRRISPEALEEMSLEMERQKQKRKEEKAKELQRKSNK